MSKETENYIEHEVKLRVIKEVTQAKFNQIDDTFNKIDMTLRHLETMIDTQFKWTLAIMITMFGGFLITKLV